MVFFDHNATTPLRPEARAAWLAAADEAWMNPSSPYPAAARVRHAVEGARAELSDLLGARAEEIVFTAGATEGANLILGHFARTSSAPILIGATEHPCVRECAEHGPAPVEILPVEPEGHTCPDRLAARLREGSRPALVALMAANNETGVENDPEALARICREAAVPFFCDAVQWIGKRPLASLHPVDGLIGSAHKFGGPKGVGFVRLGPAFGDVRGARGGQQEGGRRAGTENFPGIAAMMAALRSAQTQVADKDAIALRETWRAAFIERMEGLGCRVVEKKAFTLWNTVLLIPPTGERMRWVMRLAKQGFAVSTGSACSTGRESPSAVLHAMGESAEAARRAIRISSGWETRKPDWMELANAMESTLADLAAEKNPATVIRI